MSQNYGQPPQNKPTKAPMRPMRPPMSMHTQGVGPFTQVYQNPPRVPYQQPYTNQQFFQPNNVVFQQQMQQPVNTTMPQQSNQSNAPRKPPVVPSSNPSMRQRFSNPPITSNNQVSISMNQVPNEQSLQMPSNVVPQHNRPNIPPQPQNQNQPVNGSTININTTSMQVPSNVNQQNQNQQNITSNQVQSNQTSTKAPIITIGTTTVQSNVPKTNMNTNTNTNTNNNNMNQSQQGQQLNQQQQQQQQQPQQDQQQSSNQPQQTQKQQSSNQPPQQQQQKQQTPQSTSSQSRSPNRTKKQPRKSPQIRQNPWEQFTGKKGQPAYCSWAQSTRQVLSGDTLQLALPKPPTNPYQPAKLFFFTLDGIRTPRVQRRETKQGEKSEEQPYGYEAREFVRMAVGTKPLYFAAWSSSKSKPPRYYGDVYITTRNGERKSLTALVVAEGYASVKQAAPNLSDKEYHNLKKLERIAKDKKKGLWSGYRGDDFDDKLPKPTNKNRRTIVYQKLPAQREEVFDKYKNKIIPGIVDQVISGSILRIELMPKHKEGILNHEMVRVSLAGVKCRNMPFLNRDSNKPVPKPPPFAEAAKEWTSERLCGQRVNVKIVAHDTQFNLYAQILHPAGKIAVILLKHGLGEYERWTATLTDEQVDLEKAYKHASTNRLKIYSNKNIKEEKKISGTVVNVMSGDTFIIRTLDGREQRYTLSSVRAPRVNPNSRRNQNQNQNRNNPNNRNQNQNQNQNQNNNNNKNNRNNKNRNNRNNKNQNNDNTNRNQNNTGNNNNNNNRTPDRPRKDTTQEDIHFDKFGRMAKEFLRKKLIGQVVDLHWEYDRTTNDGRRQDFATVYLKEENVADSLLRNGLAKLVGRGFNDDKSRDFQKLVQTENLAKKNRHKKGYHNKKVKFPQIIDYSVKPKSSGAPQVSKKELIAVAGALKSKKHKAIVEYVFSGHRVKVYVEVTIGGKNNKQKKHRLIPVGLANIRCNPYFAPKLNNNNDNVPDTNDIWGKQAYEFMRDNVLQREVMLQITEANPLRNEEQNHYAFYGRIEYQGKDLAELLVQKGLAVALERYSYYYGYDNSKTTPEDLRVNKLVQMQQTAQENKVGMWVDYINDETVYGDEETKQEEQQEEEPYEIEEKQVVVSHVDSGSQFWVNDLANNDKFKQIETALNGPNSNNNNNTNNSNNNNDPNNNNNNNSNNNSLGRLRPGKLVAAKYNSYYSRARISRRDQRAQNQWFVVFVDYGNRAAIKEANMKPLPTECESIPDLAFKCQLAGLIAPYRQRQRFYSASGQALGRLVPGQLTMKTYAVGQTRYDSREYVELFNSNGESVNLAMVSQGQVDYDNDNWYLLERNFSNKIIKDYTEELVKLRKIAVDRHLGIFVDGEIVEGDDYNTNY